MNTRVVQRWRERVGSYRPAGEPFDPRAHEVVAIPDDTTAKRFVVDHHYSASYPAARWRFGLYERGALVGVAVYSVPMRAEVLKMPLLCGFCRSCGCTSELPRCAPLAPPQRALPDGGAPCPQ